MQKKESAFEKYGKVWTWASLKDSCRHPKGALAWEYTSQSNIEFPVLVCTACSKVLEVK